MMPKERKEKKMNVRGAQPQNLPSDGPGHRTHSCRKPIKQHNSCCFSFLFAILFSHSQRLSANPPQGISSLFLFFSEYN